MKYCLLYFSGIIFLWSLCSVTSQADSIFKCDFEKDDCGFFNDDGHEARWQRKRMDLGGRTGTVMAVETGGKKRQMARLMSPMFDGFWSNAEGCLSLDLYTAGDGINAFRIKQQDETGILRLLGVHTEVQKWRKYSLHIDVGDFARFILEAHVNPELGGTLVAIDNVSFELADCKD